jgi:outer membrane protein assembly factor BamB
MRAQILSLFVALSCCAIVTTNLHAEDWLRFRGQDGSGVSASDTSFPEEFDDTKNVNWKIELPGAGASSPIIVGDRIFVTCYSGYGEERDNPGEMKDLRRHVVCFNKSDGSKIWQKDYKPEVEEDPFQGMGVPEHGYTSSTPVSDGKNVYVFFGKSGVLAFDLDGKELWKTSVGENSGRMKWGSGASPVLHENVLVVNAADESESLVGLDTKTGEELWRCDGIANVWSTPIVVGEGEDASVVVSVPYEIWGLNPKSGKLRWYTTNGVQDSSVSASPMLHGDKVIAMGGRSQTGVSIRTGGKGDVTESHTEWSGKSIARIMTPIVYDGHVFGISRGIVTCVSAETGEEVYKKRLPATEGAAPARRGPSSNYCSPVAADGKIFQFAKDGTCYVIAASEKFEVLAVNKFADDGSEFNSTPAFSDGKMFVRSNKYLYSIGQ